MSRTTRAPSALAASYLLTAAPMLISMSAVASSQTRLVSAAPNAPAAPTPPKADQSGGRQCPQSRYTPQKNWMNDLSRFVYYDGEHHMFYQCDPEGSDQGSMPWSHAVFKDLVHWQELGVVIPYTPQYEVSSGSMIIDTKNIPGLDSPDDLAMVAVQTRADVGSNQFQPLVYSTDRDRIQNLYNNRDLILDIDSNEFRDPKVFWGQTSGR